MEILLLKQPYEVSFTGNPMPFVFSVAPYSSTERAMDIRLSVRVQIEKTYNSGNFADIRSQSFYPDTNGLITVDVSNIIHPYLSFYTPNLNLSIPVECIGQRLRYKIIYLLYVANTSSGTSTESSILNAVKGGLAYQEWHPTEFFTQYIATNKKPLNFLAAGEKFGLEEYKWLFWTNFINSIAAQTVEIAITYDDLSTQLIVLPQFITVAKWGICCAPIGIKQVLDSIPADKFIVSYTVCVKLYNLTFNPSVYNGQLLQGTGAAIYSITTGRKTALTTAQWNALGNPTPTTVTDEVISAIPDTGSPYIIVGDYQYLVSPFTITIDHRNFYRTYQLFYRNSIGGFETIRLRAQVDMEGDYARQQALRVLPPSYFQDSLLIAQQIEQSVFETLKYSGNTGFMSRDAATKVRDLFLSKDRWELEETKMIPVILNSKNAKFFSNRDNLISIQIDWNRAYLNQYFTPKLLMPQSRSCPALESLQARQVNASTLQIAYSAPSPYDLVQVQIIIGSNTYTYQYKGNTNTVRQAFINPNPSGTTAISVHARVICNKDISPMDMGAETVVNLTVTGSSNLVANDDTYYLAGGYTTDVILSGSVMANDYDPDGQPVEVLATSGDTYGDGTTPGHYSINASGIITYRPPSSVFYGRDYFTYTFRDQAHTRSVTAKAYIVVGTAPAGVFAVIVLRNLYDSGGAGGDTSESGEVWIDFFSDAGGANPLDVTALGLTVNYRQREQTHTNSASPQDVTTDTNLSVTPSATKVKIFEGMLAQTNWIDTLGGTYNSDNLTFTVLAGSGYVPL